MSLTDEEYRDLEWRVRQWSHMLGAFPGLSRFLDDVDVLLREVAREHPEASVLLNRPIRDLGLSVRAENCLESEGISTIGRLIDRTEDDLGMIRNLGPITLDEIRKKLAEQGFRLRPGSGFSPEVLRKIVGGGGDTPVAPGGRDGAGGAG